MKVTDFAPRTSEFETYLTGRGLIGIEIGVDVGAHAESILTYADVDMLYLVDPWANIERRGYCAGRLARWYNQITLVQATSAKAASKALIDFDFVYLDIPQDYETIKAGLNDWWPKLKPGGVFCCRNYGGKNDGLIKACDEFIKEQTKLIAHCEIVYPGEMILVKWK